MNKDVRLEICVWPAGGGMAERVRTLRLVEDVARAYRELVAKPRCAVDLVMASQLAVNLIWGPERILAMRRMSVSLRPAGTGPF